jgi:prepilin-type N-terminal cleavage/methylation domain-containing protein
LIRPGFSIVEMLVALTISATLLAATLSAFDASWRSYKQTTESASTHVVSRIVMHRLLAMIRTGTQFGPYPADFFDPDENPVDSQYIEFQEPHLAALNQITRIESRLVGTSYELWYVRLDNSVAPAAVVEEYPLLRDLVYARFVMEYEPGPRLVRATVDLTIAPNDYEDIDVDIGPDTPIIRLVASAEPRQLQIDEE